MRLGGQRELARELDCSPGYINGLAKNNDYRIVKVGKKIDLDASIDKFAKSGYGSKSKESKNKKKSKNTKPKNDKEKKYEDVSDKKNKGSKDLPELEEGTPREELDRIKLYEQARKIRIENDTKEKTLLDRVEVENTYFEIGRHVRDSLETIPSRVSSLCVDKTKHEIEQILVSEIKRTLLNLADKII